MWGRRLDSMHYLSEEHILVFLIQIFVLLAAAKTAGSLFHRHRRGAMII